MSKRSLVIPVGSVSCPTTHTALLHGFQQVPPWLSDVLSKDGFSRSQQFRSFSALRSFEPRSGRLHVQESSMNWVAPRWSARLYIVWAPGLPPKFLGFSRRFFLEKSNLFFHRHFRLQGGVFVHSHAFLAFSGSCVSYTLLLSYWNLPKLFWRSFQRFSFVFLGRFSCVTIHIYI